MPLPQPTIPDHARPRRDTPTSAQTRSGIFFDFAFPSPEHIRMADIAEGLAKQPRFMGATAPFYSVAQHSVLVSDIVERELNGSEAAIRLALFHDAEEAYTGDLVTGFKHALHAFGGGAALNKIVDRIRAAIMGRFGLPWPCDPADWALVKKADMIALATEKRDLLAHDLPWAMKLPAPRRHGLRALAWPDALDRFLARCKVLGIVDRDALLPAPAHVHLDPAFARANAIRGVLSSGLGS